MSREIKFRAWNIEDKIWNFYDLNTAKGQGRIFNDYDFNIHSELMQYTGLKDKNGKEIYEGDIVIPTGWEEQPEEVKWNNLLLQYRLGEDATRILAGADYKIIGNIYENPELLENK